MTVVLFGLMQDEISSLKSKLEECKGQLQSNEQMIRWLNNQVPTCSQRARCSIHDNAPFVLQAGCRTMFMPAFCRNSS